jgi:hypothetical protein
MISCKLRKTSWTFENVFVRVNWTCYEIKRNLRRTQAFKEIFYSCKPMYGFPVLLIALFGWSVIVWIKKPRNFFRAQTSRLSAHGFFCKNIRSGVKIPLCIFIMYNLTLVKPIAMVYPRICIILRTRTCSVIVAYL